MGQGVVAPKMPELLQGNVDLAWESGVSAGLMYLGIFLSTHFYGRWADRGYVHRLLTGGLWLYIFTLVGLAFSNSLISIYAARFVEGIALCAVYVAADFVLGRLSPREERGQWLSYYGVALSTGLLLGPLIGLGSAQVFPGLTLIPFLGVASLAFIASLFTVKLRVGELAESPAGGEPATEALSPDLQVLGKPSTRTPASSGKSWGPLAMGVNYGYLEAGLVAVFPVVAIQEFQTRPEWCLVIVILVAAVTSIAWGMLSDRIGAVPVLWALMGILTLGALLLAGGRSWLEPFPYLVTSCVFFGAVAGGVYPVAFSWLLGSVPDTHYGQASASFSRAYGLGSLLGPLLAGFATQAQGVRGLMLVQALAGGLGILALKIFSAKEGARSRGHGNGVALLILSTTSPFFAVQAFASGQNSAVQTRSGWETRYQIRAELFPETRKIRSHQTLVLTNQTQQPQIRLYFYMYPNAFRNEDDGTYWEEMRPFEHPDHRRLSPRTDQRIELKSLASPARTLKFRVQQEILTVTLDRPLAPSESMNVEFEFETELGAISERSGTWDDNFSVGHWYPKLVVYDEQGWALKHNRGYHFIGEFYGNLSSYEVEITVPEAFRVGATGTRKAIEVKAGKSVSTYSANHVRDFAFVADSHYQEEEHRVGSTRVHVLYRNEDYQRIGEVARDALKTFSEQLIPYPYSDYTVAETYYNGTMEYPQITFVKSYPAWLSRKIENGWTRLVEYAVVHETAHQWFFGMVANNEVTHAWLDEGFTQYLELDYFNKKYGRKESLVRGLERWTLPDDLLRELIWAVEGPQVTQAPQTAAHEFRSPNHYFATVYYKVANFFIHFREVVGEEKFNDFLKAYLKMFLHQVVRPEQVFSLVHQKFGEVAEEWWRQWIETSAKSDYAVESLESLPSPMPTSGSVRSILKVRQNRDLLAPVQIEWEDEDGTQGREWLKFDRQSSSKVASLELNRPKAIVDFEIDPDHTAVDEDRFNNRTQLLPKVSVLPFSSERRPFDSDRWTLLTLPLFQVRPEIGGEAGIFLAGTRFTSGYGYGFLSYNWDHRAWNSAVHLETQQLALPVQFQLDYERNLLIHQGRLTGQLISGKLMDYDPRLLLDLGLEYFGDLPAGRGDGIHATGLGLSLVYSDLTHGQDRGFRVGLHTAVLKAFPSAETGFRYSGEGELRFRLAYKMWLKLTGIVGGMGGGELGRSARYSLLAEREGGMRFQAWEDGNWRVKTLAAFHTELRVPLVYGPWMDRLAVLEGPSWSLRTFADFSGSGDFPELLVDWGIGTQVGLALGGWARLALNLDFVPFQTAVAPKGFGLPSVFLYLSATGL
jgi:MFS family permease